MMGDMHARAIATLLALFGACVLACSGDDDGSSGGGGGGIDTSICDATSKCANEPSKTDAQKESCKRDLQKCEATYRAFDTCYRQNEVCDSAGKTDINASTAKCTKERDEYLKCALGQNDSPDGG